MSSKGKGGVGGVCVLKVWQEVPEATKVGYPDEGESLGKILGVLDSARHSLDKSKSVPSLKGRETVISICHKEVAQRGSLTMFSIHALTPSSESITASYLTVGRLLTIEASQ